MMVDCESACNASSSVRGMNSAIFMRGSFDWRNKRKVVYFINQIISG